MTSYKLTRSVKHYCKTRSLLLFLGFKLSELNTHFARLGQSSRHLPSGTFKLANVCCFAAVVGKYSYRVAEGVVGAATGWQATWLACCYS